MRLVLALFAVLLGLGQAHADGLTLATPGGPNTQGQCYASGTSGPRVPCVLQGQTWTRVLRPTDPIDGATVGGVAIPAILGSKAPLASPTFTGTVTAPSYSGDASVLRVKVPGQSVDASLASLFQTTVYFALAGGLCDGNPASAPTNDTAITRALYLMDQAPYGAKLVFPTGLCYFSQPFTLKTTDGKHNTYSGQGKLATKLMYTGTSVGNFITVGSTVAGGDSSNTIIEGFSVYPPTQAAANAAGARAFYVNSRPNIVFRDMAISGYDEGIYLEKSYAPRITDVTFTNIKGRAIRTAADATANGMTLTRVGAFNCGLTYNVPALDIIGGSDGLSGNGVGLIGVDFETNYQGVRFTNINGAFVGASYIERNEQGNLLFAGSNRSFKITGNWIGEQAVPLTFAGLSNSVIQANTFYNVAITPDASALDIDYGAATYLGTASQTAPWPWNTPTLNSGWTNVGGSYEPIGYRRHADGSIEFKGLAMNSTANSTSGALFTLPAGARVAKVRQFLTAGLIGNGTSNVELYPNGNVVVYPSPGGYASLEGVRVTP